MLLDFRLIIELKNSTKDHDKYFCIHSEYSYFLLLFSSKIDYATSETRLSMPTQRFSSESAPLRYYHNLPEDSTAYTPIAQTMLPNIILVCRDTKTMPAQLSCQVRCPPSILVLQVVNSCITQRTSPTDSTITATVVRKSTNAYHPSYCKGQTPQTYHYSWLSSQF